MSQDNRLQSLHDLRAIDLPCQTHSNALVESAGALVSVDRVLEVQVLDRRKREACARDSPRASSRLLLRRLGESGSLRELFDRVRLDDVLQTDGEALLAGLGHHGHAGDTIAT